MTAFRIPASRAECLCAESEDSAVSGAGVRIRAHTFWRQQATMVSISGDVDAVTLLITESDGRVRRAHLIACPDTATTTDDDADDGESSSPTTGSDRNRS